MTNEQVDRILAFKAIEDQATTPLKPDQSEDLIFQWHDPRNELPASGNSFPKSILTLIALDDDYTVGYYDYAKKYWQTDLGAFTSPSILYWASIPKLPS